MKKYFILIIISYSFIYSQSLNESVENHKWEYPLIRKVNQTWDMDHWKDNSQYLFSYDINNYLIEWSFQYSINEIWENESKTINEYNSIHQLIHSFRYYWSNDWILNSRSTNLYDSLGNQTQSLGQLWRNNEWINFTRQLRGFDGNLLTYQIFQTFRDSSWLNQSRYTYMYDSFGNNIEYISEDWYGNNWEKISRYTFSYDANNNWIENIIYIWNNEWEPYQKYERSYENENLIEELEYYWSPITNNFEYTFKKYFQYEQSLLKNEFWSYYSDSLSTWLTYIMFNSNYNNNNLLNERIKYYWSDSTYILSQRELYFYNITGSIKNEILTEDKISLDVYPNPFNSSFKLRLNIQAPEQVTIYLYDILGRRIKTLLSKYVFSNNSEFEFNLNDLSSGVYLINLEINQNIITKKLVYMK